MNRLLLSIAVLFLCTITPVRSQMHWETTNGPSLDKPSVIAVNTNGDILASSGRVLLRSQDGGVTWSRISLPKYLGQIQGITTLPGSKIFLRMDNGVLVRVQADGSQRQTLAYKCSVANIADRAGTLFSEFTGSSIARSTNAGDSWDTVMGPQGETLNGFNSNGFTSDEQRYYVTTGSGLYTSTDRGQNWKRCLNGLTTMPFYVIQAGHNGHVWATAGDGSSHDGSFYFSTNYGLQWTRVGAVDYYFYGIIPDANNEIIFASSMYFHDSTIQGISPPNDVGHHVRDSAGRWLSVNSGTPNLYYSTGGKPAIWKGSNIPFSTSPVLFNTFSGLLVGSGSNLFVQDQIGGWIHAKWNSTTPLFTNYNDNSVLGTTNGNDLQRSTDSGKTWKNILGAFPTGTVRSAVSTNNRIYASTKGVYYTDDIGKTWNETNDNALQSAVGVLCADSSGRLYANCQSGLFRSINSGDAWQQLTLPIKLTPTVMRTNRAGTLAYFGTGEQMMISTDHGDTWNWYYLPDHSSITDLLLTDAGDVFASSGTGVYYWPHGDLYMYDVSAGLDSLGVNALAQDAAGVIYASTAGAGVYKAVGKPQFLAVRTSSSQPLLAAFPNPATDRISIALPTTAAAWTVSARDPLGREVPIRSAMSGEYLQCDLSTLPPGAYELLLNSSGSSYQSRFAIVR